jgi:hypothetical protein
VIQPVKNNINNLGRIFLMLKKSKLLSAAIFSAAALLASNGQADTMGTPKISAMSIVNGLENPWDMAFTKKGDMFFYRKM